jgi:hypothetical protein
LVKSFICAADRGLVAVEARAVRRVTAFRSLGIRAEVGALHVLGGIVAASFLLRLVAGWLRATPVYFADEYIYAELGRSIAETGRPLIRGTAAQFPALLHPILTAPAWLFEDVEVSFRLVQVLGAFAMSLAAVPVFLLCRRLGLAAGWSLTLAFFAVAVPDLLYASWVVAEPVAYPLALTAVLVGTAALARPSRRSQLGFVVLAGLATFARIQFIVLPLAFVGAVLVVGLRERRVRGALREQALVLGVYGAILVGALATGPGRVLGYYHGVLDLEFGVVSLLTWFGSQALVLAYASGWVLVPGALIGLALAFWSPVSRTELAFAALSAFLTLGLLFEGALYAASGGNRVQERYFFYALPFVAIFFVLYARRGWPHRLPHALLAAGLVLVAARVPLSGFAAAEGKTNSPLLIVTGVLERAVGDVGLASLLFAAGAAVFSLAGVAAMYRLRARTPFVVALATAACVAGSVVVVANDHRNTTQVREIILPDNPSWIDASGVEDVAFLQTPLGNRGFATEQLFWNRSVKDLLVLPETTPVDAFSFDLVRIASDGSLLIGSQPVERPLAVEAYGTTLSFRGARVAARSAVYRLLVPEGRPRLSLYMPGRHWDGWLAPRGEVRLWPEPGSELAGRLTFTLSVPGEADGAAVSFGPEVFRLGPGSTQSVELRVCSAGEWRAPYQASFTGTVGDRLVSVQASEPIFRSDPSACA